MEQDGVKDDSKGRGLITLHQPRPGTARRQNEYIDTPLRPDTPKRPRKVLDCRPPLPQPITVQPKKEEPALDHGDSIICRQCSKCKCQACRTPRSLPSRWVCNNKCLCSPATVVDYCSCMCCVRGLFYHWAKDYEIDSDVSCADQPCSCAPHQRLLRWGCLGLLSLPLPCLCCYWPLRGCLKGCGKCYAGCTGHGCRCAPQHRTERAPDKRLLDSDC